MALDTSVELVGRHDERASLLELVADVAPHPAAALIRGEAGIGKTALWRAGVDAAERRGLAVLVTRCAETEMPLALGALADLLDAAFAEVGAELSKPQRKTLAVALGFEAPFEASDPIALPRALLACLRALAERAPVLIAIDDVQWLDSASRRILAWVVRRLRHTRVRVIATQRGEAGDALGLRRAFEERFVEIDLGRLDAGQIHELVRTRLGLRLTPSGVARVHAASGGNPMFALEFARVAATAGAPLPVPASLELLVRERVRALPRHVLPLLAAASAAERPTIPLLQAAVEDADRLLDDAVAAGALTAGADGAVRFTHPLLASAAYAAVPPSARYGLHARLAAASDDAQERARHLALSTFEPSDGVASVLDEAAALARMRGAPDAAATLAEHALRLTPADDGGGRDERVLAIAGYLADAGERTKAAALLDELLAGPISRTQRVRALLLASLIEPDLETMRRLLEEARELTDGEPELRVRTLLALGTYPLAHGDLAGAAEIVAEARTTVEEVDDPALRSAALMCAGEIAELRGQPEPVLLERAVELAGDNPPIHGFLPPRSVLAELRLSSGDLEGARALLEPEHAAVQNWGDENLIQGVLRMLVRLEWLAGDWDRAERHLGELSELVFDGQDESGESLMLWQQALLAASRGRVEEARRLAHEAVTRGAELHLPWLVARGRWVLAFLALSLDRPAEAWAALDPGREAWEHLVEAQPRYAWIAPEVIESAVGVGQLREAQSVLKSLETPRRENVWAASAATRCRALLRLARGDVEAAEQLADEAARGFEAGGFPLDRGRSLLVAGDALRRAGARRRAAERLASAQDTFAELGAPLWLARAEKELRRALPRPRRDGDLTDAERRVALLVAEGRTNREVAAQLFTTVGTVEVHLTRIYRKLEVRSRTELARLAADGALSQPATPGADAAPT